MNAAEEVVASPCISVCVIDEPSGLCAGCYRTLDEIAAWIDLSPSARRAIVEEIPRRRSKHGAAIEHRQAAHAKR